MYDDSVVNTFVDNEITNGPYIELRTLGRYSDDPAFNIEGQYVAHYMGESGVSVGIAYSFDQKFQIMNWIIV